MKRRQVKAKAEKQTKPAARKVEPPKEVPEVEDSAEEDEPVVQAIEAKKATKQIAAKTKKVGRKPKIVEPEEEEDVEDEPEEQVCKDEETEDETEENNEQPCDDDDEDDQNDDDDEQNEDDDEQNEDGDDEQNDGTEEDEEEDDDDEQASPSEILVGPFQNHFKPYQCIHVTNLPKKCKQINIVEAFAKFGAIKQIHIVTTIAGTYADIAFKTAKAAAAALADNEKVKVGDSMVSISKWEDKKSHLHRDRTVCVRNINDKTSEENLREAFEHCGEIEGIKLLTSKIGNTPMAFITFVDKESIPAALKLHNSIVNDSNIKVFENTQNRESKRYDENFTVLLKNKQDFNSIDTSKLESIFSKCGEIDFMDIICKKYVLAFITFKTEQATKKALEMNGKTRNGIILEVEPYSGLKKWTSIHVVNLPKGCTEEDLKTHFAKAGEIANIVCKGAYGIIRFEDSDGFCKSFLYNESFLKGQMIFIEPFSNRKSKVLHKNKFNRGKEKGFKRSFDNGHNTFKPKAKKSKLN